MKLRWSHAVIYVRDLGKMVDFYRDVLGFEVSDRGPLFPGDDAPEVVFMSQSGSDHHQLAFAPVRGEGPSTTLDHMAFRVDALSDVKKIAAELEADGRADNVRSVNHGNAWSVYFQDPEDNGLEVFCDSPWSVKQPQLQPLDLSMSEDELRRHTEEQFGKEPGFEPMEKFYEQQRRRHQD